MHGTQLRRPVVLGLALLGLSSVAPAAHAREPYEGLTLLSPMVSNATHLIDMQGAIVATWHGACNPASIAYLLADGSVMRPSKDPSGHFNAAPGAGGRIQRIDAGDQVIWDFTYSTPSYQQHHDIEPLPDGNVLLIAWERKTRDEALAAGRQQVDDAMWPVHIVEVEPAGSSGGIIVWEWHVWDHLIQDVDPGRDNFGVVADHPELVDVNYAELDYGGDWNHCNAIDYNPERDQIVIGSRAMEEFWVIDHGTTTEEAAGHTGGASGMGGDLLYRWGNPQVYRRGTDEDRRFDVIHGVNWIDAGLPGAGGILAFNNGDREGTADDWSTVDEIRPPLDPGGHYYIAPDSAFGPAMATWSYGGPGGFYGGATQGGAYRLPDGNTLICGSVGGHLFEVTEIGETVWEYWHGEMVARAPRYWHATASLHPSVDATLPADGHGLRLEPVRPNPSRPGARIGFAIDRIADVSVSLGIYDVTGRCVALLVDGRLGDERVDAVWDGRDARGRAVASGTYVVRLEAGAQVASQKLTLVR